MFFLSSYLSKIGLIFILSIIFVLVLISCRKTQDSTNSSDSCYASSAFDKGSCSSTGTLTASNQVPLLVVRVQYNNACFNSDETTWANKMFGTTEGQLNHYLAETTYDNYQFSPASESSGCSNDGVITVNMDEDHPNTQKNSWACYAAKAIAETDSNINFAAFDTDSNGKLSNNELQVIFLIAGGESATSLNSPGGVWAMASSLLCDLNGDGLIADVSGEHGITLDNVRLLGVNSTTYGQNGYSQFGEKHGFSSTISWDATIGVIAHELGHAYFDLPDFYNTYDYTASSGIGAFGVMGGGAWGYKSQTEKSGSTPVHFNAWSKEKLGVCTPQDVSSGADNYTLPAVYQMIDNSSSCGIYKASTSNSDEYFLFENRYSGGYDEGLKELIYESNTDEYVGTDFGGLAVWHVKDILSSCLELNNCVVLNPPLLDLEEANDADLDSASSNGRTTHLFYSGNNDTFDNSTTPSSNLYDDNSSDISLSNISVAGDNMTLTISK